MAMCVRAVQYRKFIQTSMYGGLCRWGEISGYMECVRTFKSYRFMQKSMYNGL